MSATIEIQDHLRAKLLKLAARRGLKGVSTLVEEAIEQYLEEHAPRDVRIEVALSVLGTMNEEDANAMEHSIQLHRAPASNSDS